MGTAVVSDQKMSLIFQENLLTWQIKKNQKGFFCWKLKV